MKKISYFCISNGKRASMTLKELAARIRRMGSGHGFGIQSPSDYRFVCDVVNCRHPYYAYADLKRENPGMTGRERKKAELIFRIANFVQPDTAMNFGMKPLFEAYLKRACRKVTVLSTADCGDDAPDHTLDAYAGKRCMLLLSCDSMQTDEDTGNIMRYMLDGNCLIADGINSSEKARQTWRRIAGDSRCTLVFDLYDIGIVTAKSKREKTLYKINY